MRLGGPLGAGPVSLRGHARRAQRACAGRGAARGLVGYCGPGRLVRRAAGRARRGGPGAAGGGGGRAELLGPNALFSPVCLQQRSGR